jgi:hypothetical protein
MGGARQVWVIESHVSAPQHSALLVHAWPALRQLQEPASWSQTSAPQHSAPLMHVSPLFAQPHVPPSPSQRSAPQQSEWFVHMSPVRAHPQIPLTHWPEQQSPASAHIIPSCVQDANGFTQFMLIGSQSKSPQQSKSVMQLPPTSAQAGAHVPLLQKLEQQSPLAMQLLPSAVQLGPPPSPPASPPPPPPSPPEPPEPHLPAVQVSEQHSAKLTQDALSGVHITLPPSPPPPSAEPPHLLFTQLWAQQSLFIAQLLPLGMQLGTWAAHTPPMHLLLQQSPAAWQAEPLLLHPEALHIPPLQSWLQHSLLEPQATPVFLHIG